VGDLRTLRNIAFHTGVALPASTQIERLRKRGFLALTARGTYRMTVTGWSLSFSEILMCAGRAATARRSSLCPKQGWWF
jgi:hypothetical protein